MSDERSAQENAIAEHFGWQVIENSKRRDGVSCTAPDGSRICLRFDWPSVETGNHYLEVESRANRESSWKASAFGIARKKADLWVVVNGREVYVADIKLLNKRLKRVRGDIPDHVSRRNIGDFDKRMYARGHLLPLEELEECCKVICVSPIQPE
jgi:hypothetical protein